jgi:hypothetical protein
MLDAERAAAAAAGDSQMLPLLLTAPLLPLLLLLRALVSLVVVLLGSIPAPARATCWGTSSCVQARHGIQVIQRCFCCCGFTVLIL